MYHLNTSSDLADLITLMFLLGFTVGIWFPSAIDWFRRAWKNAGKKD